MPKPFVKPPTTFQQQLDLLKRRGMVVADEPAALHSLQHSNYYRLRAYWLPFEATGVAAGDHQFVAGTTFEQVIQLYEFDRQLRTLVGDALAAIEVSFRTSWAYWMAHNTGAHGYLDAVHFSDPAKHAAGCVSVRKTLAESREVFVKHYRATYDAPPEPPVWAVCEILTFGELSRWHEQLGHTPTRVQIASTYGIHASVFDSVMHHLSYVRNVCAHHGRLWNRVMTIKLPTPRNPTRYAGAFHSRMPDRVYNTLTTLAYLLEIVAPTSTWKTQIKALIASQPAFTTNRMGFLNGWQALDLWR
jgi:abortive infection bacteriophage resistance protein